MMRRLPAYELQGEIHDPHSGGLVTRPDMLFPDKRLAVYADGADYHSRPERMAHDERTRAQELGYRILAFAGTRIHHDVDGCVDDIVYAL